LQSGSNERRGIRTGRRWAGGRSPHKEENMRFHLARRSSSARAPLWTLAACVAAPIALGLPASRAAADGWVCSHTAFVQRAACRAEVTDDLLTAKAICLNFADDEEREACLDEAKEEAGEERDLCSEQFVARLEVCGLIGQQAYDPDFDPEDFDSDFTDLTMPNPYYPLTPGNTWSLAGGEETIELEILEDTKNVEGVTCITLHDVVREEGVVIEDTHDWLAQHVEGDTWYCGEIAQDFETFPGDDPEEPELVSIDGSWKHGRDGAKAGIWVPKNLPAGTTYRQEWAAGDAEDVGTVLSTTYSYGNGEGLDDLVPEELAELLCDDDCMVTRDFTATEPGVSERKYYAPGIGNFLEVNLDDGEVVQLVDCNFDARCDDLPEPEDD
jgi:hypothetical protein